MSELEHQIEACLAQNDYAQAARLAESALDAMPPTAFHAVKGRSLLLLTEDVANYISWFFDEARKAIDVKAMFFEMNSFSVNPDLWYFDSTAFSFCGNPDDPEDTDWLADWEFMLPDTVFPITGYEDLQEACRDHMENRRYSEKLQRNALEAFEPVVGIRFMELLAHAVQFAKDNNFVWKDIPVFGTAHDGFPLYRSSCK